MLVATNYTSNKVIAGYVREKVLYIYSGGANAFNQYDTSGTYVGQVRDDDGSYCDLFMATLTDQDVTIRRWELVEQSAVDIDLNNYEMY